MLSFSFWRMKHFWKKKPIHKLQMNSQKVGKRTKHYGSIISISKNKIVHEFLCLKSPVTKELNCIKGSFKNFTWMQVLASIKILIIVIACLQQGCWYENKIVRKISHIVVIGTCCFHWYPCNCHML
jgi:hypothetical protein